MIKEIRPLIALGTAFVFLANTLLSLPQARAEEFFLPQPGVMINLSPAFNPSILKGIKIHSDNPFRFDFILDKGDSNLTTQALKDESTRLIKYFLASLTIPEKDLWVNLSPYEKDRIVPESFGQTEMGRDLLAQDYILKQITASLIYPERDLGKKFWDRIYKLAQEKYGTTDIPINTFNKVWIVPEEALVYENEGSAYIESNRLKVMLEEDYLALSQNDGKHQDITAKETNTLGSQIVREIVIPQLEKEVNEGKNFAPLRQVYNSLILAVWYKDKLKSSILNQVYSDQNKTLGVTVADKQEKQKIYEQYLEAFKKGVYNYIKEDYDPTTKETIPRKYFSGGFGFTEILGKMHRDQYPQGFQPQHQFTIIQSEFEPAHQGPDRAMAASAIQTTSKDEPLIYGPMVTNYEQRRKSTDPNERNAVYINPVIQDGKMISCQYFESFPNGAATWLFKRFGEFVVKNIELDPRRGSFVFGGITWWWNLNKDNVKGNITVHFKEGQIMAAYDEDGQVVYQREKSDEPNTVYLNAKFVNGKRHRGVKQGVYQGAELRSVIQSNVNVTVANVSLDKEGGLTVAGKIYWTSMATHKNAKSLTVHFINGQLEDVYDKRGIPLYTNLKESDGKAVFINASIKDGKRVGGNLVEVFTEGSSRDVLFEYPEFIVTNATVDNTASFTFAGVHWWATTKLIPPNSPVTAHFKNGWLYRAYDGNGRLIYRDAQEGDTNSVYTGAKIENGKRVGGKFFKAYPTGIKQEEFFRKHDEFVITGVRLNNHGEFRWRIEDKDYFWFSSTEYALIDDVMVYFKNNEAVYACRADGTFIWKKPEEGERNSLYTGATIKDGKRVGGNFVAAYPNFKSEFYDQYDEFVLTNVKLQHDGSLNLTNKMFWNRLVGYEYAEGVTLYFKEGELQSAFDIEGKQIFANEDTGIRNALYLEGTVENGKRMGGKYIRSFPNVFPARLFDKYKDFVIENAICNSIGGFMIGSQLVFQKKEGFENKKGLRVHVKDGKIAGIYEKDGTLVYAPPVEGGSKSLYINAKIEKGKRVGGEFINSYPVKPPEGILDQYPDFILTNVELSPIGAFSFGGEHFILRLEHKDKKNVTAHIKDKKLIEAFDENGEKIFGALVEGDRNTVYVDAQLDDAGKRIGGVFHEAYGDTLSPELLRQFDQLVVTNVHLQGTGALFIGGKIYWGQLPSHKNVKGVTLYFKGGELISAFDKDGVQIFTNDLSTKNNVIYINGTIEQGKRKGGEFFGYYGKIQSIHIEGHADVIIENIDINNKKGVLEIAGNTYWRERPELANAQGLTAYFQNGILIGVYDKEGKQIYDGKINQIYIGARLENGRKVDGKWVTSTPIYIPQSLFDQQNDFIVVNAQLDEQGGFQFGRYWWRQLPTHVNAQGITAHFKDGVLVEAFDKDGNSLYTQTETGKVEKTEGLKLGKTAGGATYIPVQHKEGDNNSLYVGGSIESGKRVGGRFMGAYPTRMNADIVDQYPEGIIENVDTKQAGQIYLAAGSLYIGLGVKFSNKTGLTVVYKDKKITHVYDNEGNQVYPKQAQAGERNAVYVGGEIVDGKRQGGQFIDAYPTSFRGSVIDEYPSGIIENVETTTGGMINLGTGKLEIALGTKHGDKKGLMLVYKDKKVTAVYDKDGSKLSQDEAKEGDQNSVYVNAQVQNGKRTGGEFIGAFDRFDQEFFEKHPSGIIANVRISAGAQLNFASGLMKAGLYRIHERQEGYLVVYSNKVITEVYDPKGKLIYKDGESIKESYVFESQDPTDRNAVFVNGQISEQGKRIGGTFLGAFPKRGVANAFFDDHKEGIVEHVDTTAQGTINLGNGRLTLNLGRAIGQKENITILFKNEAITEVYDENGERIYPQKEGQKNSLYINAEIRDGKRVGGQFISSYPFFMSQPVFEQYPDGVIENVNTNNVGSIMRGNGTLTFFLGSQYSGQEGFLVVYKGKQIVDIYTKNGEQIVKDGQKIKQTPSEPNPLYKEGDRNSLYINATVEDGRVTSGDFISAYPTQMRKAIFEENPNGVLVNVHTVGNGVIALGGTLYARLGTDYENQEGFVIVYKDGEIVDIYDRDGNKIDLKAVKERTLSDVPETPERPPAKPKIVAKEGERNSFYINATIGEDGQRVGGEFVAAYPNRVESTVFDQHTAGVIEHVRVNGSGMVVLGNVLSAYLGAAYSSQEDMRVEFQDKKIKGIYTKEGQLVYKDGTRIKDETESSSRQEKQGVEGDRNSLYIDATIENGIMTKGTFVDAYPDYLSRDVFTTNPKGIIQHVKVNASGALSVGGGFLKVNLGTKYKDYTKDVMVVYEDGTVLEVYDEDGNRIYKNGEALVQKGDRNTLYVDAVIQNGKVTSGTMIASYPKIVPPEILDEHPSGIFENVRVNSVGNISLAAGGLLVKVGTQNAIKDGFVVVYKDKKITHVYNKDGQEIIKDGERTSLSFVKSRGEEDDENALFVNAKTDKNGNITKGEFAGAFPSEKKAFGADVVDAYPSGVIKNVHVTENGMVHLGHTYLHASLGRGYRNQTGLTVVYKDKEITQIYDSEGNLIYKGGEVVKAPPLEIPEGKEGDVNSLYVNATVEEGKLTGGLFIGAFGKEFKSRVFDEYPTGVIMNVESRETGAFSLGWKTIVINLGSQHANKKGLLVVYQNKEVQYVYDQDGILIYEHGQAMGKEGDQNSLYINATFADGKIQGEFKGAYPTIFPKKLIDQYPSGVISNVFINSSGGISLGGRALSTQLSTTFGKTDGNTVVYTDRIITQVYNKQGTLIYQYDPKTGERKAFKDQQGVEGDRNSFYTNAIIRQGKMVEGTFVGAFPTYVSGETFEDYPSGVIKHVAVSETGTISMATNSLKLYLGEQYAGHRDMMVVYRDKKITHVFDENGNLVYRIGRRIAVPVKEEIPEEMQKLMETGDLNRLLTTLGLEGTLRVLSRVHGFTIAEIKGTVKSYVGSLPNEQSEEIAGPRKFSFIRMRHIKSLNNLGGEHEAVLIQELTRSVYRNIIEDHHFLETLLKESTNENNSPVLQKAYKSVYDYYTAIINLPLNGLNDDRMILTLYQKEGIKFLMDKKHAILADDQGTGKTIQALMASMNINEGKGAKKVLIICPRSAERKVWEKEIKTRLKGSQKTTVLSKNSLSSPKRRKELEEARFVITHYDAIIDRMGEKNPLREELQAMGFDVIIVDEAHRIRNESLRTEAVKGFKAEYKFLVTGTPIVGRDVRKMYHLLNWLFPENENFQSLEKFNARYYGSAEKIRQLREDVADFLIRRLKKDVLNLQPLNQIIIPVELNPAHREAYERVENDFRNWITNYSVHGKPNRITFLSKFMRCRQAAIDPMLIEDNIIFDDGKTKNVVQISARRVKLGEKVFSIITDPITKEPLELVSEDSSRHYQIVKGKNERFVTIGQKTVRITCTRDISSSKYEALDQLVKQIKAKNPKDKILIFSTFKDVVQSVVRRYREYGTIALVGGLSENEVDSRIQQFHDDDGQTIFAATIQTGGESISLTPANHVIFINDPLTFQDKRQGIDRIYRWLQTKEVYAYTLVAKNTFDEHVSSILAEGKIVSELAFDDDPTVQNLTDEIIDELLRSFAYPEEVIDQILAFRTLSKRRDKVSFKPPLVFENKEKSLRVVFKNESLSATLALKDGSPKEFRSFNSLFENAEQLSTESQALLREFVQGQMGYDIDNKVPIKETMLWYFVQTLVPKMEHVDYHGELEKNIEIGMGILDLLMTDQNITLAELGKHVDDKLALSKALDFLDRHNILKVMSLLGILPKQYYYNGQLLFYDPPIYVSYRDKELAYRDDEIVNRIAPDRRIRSAAKSREVNFESLADRFRPLSRAEEIRLAIEAHKRNEKATEALLEHNMKLIIKISRSVFKKVQSRRLSVHFTTDDFEDVYQHVIGELTKVVGGYGVEANDRTFEEFFAGFIAKTASTYIHQKANLDRREMLIFNKELSPGSTETMGDMIAAPTVQVEEKDKPGLKLEETAAYVEMVNALKKGNFQDWEIDIFTQFVELGGIDGVLETHGQSKNSIMDIVNEARKILQASGSFKRGDGEEDEAMLSNTQEKREGGIDLKNTKIKTRGQSSRFDFSNENIKKLKMDLDGLNIKILNMDEINDLPTFLEVVNPTGKTVIR